MFSAPQSLTQVHPVESKHYTNLQSKLGLRQKGSLSLMVSIKGGLGTCKPSFKCTLRPYPLRCDSRFMSGILRSRMKLKGRCCRESGKEAAALSEARRPSLN